MPNSKKVIKLIGFFLFILLFILMGSYWLQKYKRNTKASFDGIRLVCNPHTVQASVGQELNLVITLDSNNKKVSVVDIIFDYDSSRIEIASFKQGKPFPKMLKSNIQDNKARFMIAVDPELPFLGNSVIGRLNIKVISEGVSQIKFNTNSQVAELESDKNELAATVPCEITQ